MSHCAVVYTIEFQKHDLPHARILVFLKQDSRILGAKDIDRIICAKIPDEENDSKLFQIVSTFMVHGPCGVQRPSSPYMNDGKCTKYFLKKYVPSTTIDKDGYPVYRQRDNGAFI